MTVFLCYIKQGFFRDHKERCNMNKPVIGLTASHDLKTDDLRMGHFYIDAIRKNGAIPLVLPLTLDEEEAGQLAETLDGFLFSGGPDVHPFLFGEETLTGCGDFSPLRDSSELLLLSQVYEKKKPVLGICRGAQLLNIALGGDIYQDIFSQVPERFPIAHRQPFSAAHPAHRVTLESGSRLAQITQSLSLEVNSLHHQAIRNAAPCLNVCGRASDGIIEAVEQPDHPFLVGVQWHPEQLAGKYEHADRLFSAFINACRKV